MVTRRLIAQMAFCLRSASQTYYPKGKKAKTVTLQCKSTSELDFFALKVLFFGIPLSLVCSLTSLWTIEKQINF